MSRKILTQHRVPWIGGFKETLSQVLWWGTPVNFVMLAATFYYTTMREIWPWFNFTWFIGIIILGVIIIFFIEYKYIVPSIWEFRGRQMFGYQSNIIEKLDTIIKRLDKIEGKEETSQ